MTFRTTTARKTDQVKVGTVTIISCRSYWKGNEDSNAKTQMQERKTQY